MQEKNQEQTLQAISKVIERLGKPVRFVCDEGPEFDNNRSQAYCRDMGIAVVFLFFCVPTLTLLKEPSAR